MIAVLAELESLGFGHAILFLKSVVLLHLDGLDCNLCAGEFVLTDENGIACALANRSCNDVLVQLIMEALLRQNRFEDFLALTAAIEVQHARLLQG